jgi:hypothetical protein
MGSRQRAISVIFWAIFWIVWRAFAPHWALHTLLSLPTSHPFGHCG